MTTGSNKFFIFDENKVNIMDDTTYQKSLYRTNGAVQGIAPSNLHNKLYHQATMMTSAIAQVLANQGLNVSDQDFTTLVNQLSSNLGSNRVWKASTVYAAGEVTFPTNPKSPLLLICTKGGTTEAKEPVWGSVGQTVTDGTVVWFISDLKDAGNSDTVDGKHASDFAPAGYGLGGAAKGLPNIDLNTLTECGFYNYHSSTLNRPTGNSGFVIVSYTSGLSAQIATDMVSAITYTRILQGGTWSAWRMLVAYSNFTQSLTANGWTQLPNGLILQWGKFYTTATFNVTKTLPIAFPNAIFSCVAVGDTDSQENIAVRATTNTQITVSARSYNQSIFWIAIGY